MSKAEKSPSSSSSSEVRKKIKSGVKKVSKIVSPRHDEHKKVETGYQPTSLELIQSKEEHLNEAMTLNEQMAKATKSRRDIQKQIKALNHKLETTNAWIGNIKSHPKFLDVTEIGKLYEEIKSLRSYIEAVKAGGRMVDDDVTNTDSPIVPRRPPKRTASSSTNTSNTSTSSRLSSFRENDLSEFDSSPLTHHTSPVLLAGGTEVTCSACKLPADADEASWCLRCRSHSCADCHAAAGQCPKCLEGVVIDCGKIDLDGGKTRKGKRAPLPPPPKEEEDLFNQQAVEADYLIIGREINYDQDEDEEIYAVIQE